MNRRLVRRLRKLGVSPSALSVQVQKALDSMATEYGPDRVPFAILDNLRLEQQGIRVVWAPRRFKIKETL
jgi:hypothetical protein